MSTFDLHTLRTAPVGSQEQLAEVTRVWGFTPNLHAILAESPAALIGYDTLFNMIAGTTLSPVEQQAVFLAVTVFHRCEYCTMGHTYLSRRVGMDEAALAALRVGDLPHDPNLAALCRFTRALLEMRGDVGDAVVKAFLAAGFSRANVLEVVTIIATKTISNYVNHLSRTPHEAFMSDPALAWVAPAKVA